MAAATEMFANQPRSPKQSQTQPNYTIQLQQDGAYVKPVLYTHLPVNIQDVRSRIGSGKPGVQFLVGSCKVTTLTVTVTLPLADGPPVET